MVKKMEFDRNSILKPYTQKKIKTKRTQLYKTKPGDHFLIKVSEEVWEQYEYLGTRPDKSKGLAYILGKEDGWKVWYRVYRSVITGKEIYVDYSGRLQELDKIIFER